MYITSKNNGFGRSILLQIPRIKAPIPLFIVFRALGIITDKEICQHVVLNVEDRLEQKETIRMLDGMKASIVDASTYMSQDAAIQYITSHAMYTPLNMDKETGAIKKRSLQLMF